MRSEEDEEQLEEDEKQEELRSEEVEEQYEDERQCKGPVTGKGSKQRRSSSVKKRWESGWSKRKEDTR